MMRLRVAKKIARLEYGTHVYAWATKTRARRRYLRWWWRRKRRADHVRGALLAAFERYRRRPSPSATTPGVRSICLP